MLNKFLSNVSPNNCCQQILSLKIEGINYPHYLTRIDCELVKIKGIINYKIEKGESTMIRYDPEMVLPKEIVEKVKTAGFACKEIL
jgi:hypothetical protein